ncbi:MAG TPA: ATP-binding protein [Solirubrobacterales bacterium]|nr:ATP-binding protein [Solirubrobacterales bacterium]
MLTPAFDQVVGGWPCVLAIAAVGLAGVREARRRAALNEALHEVRRPLQVLALTAPVAGTPAGDFEGPVRMAAAALERLEREINGGGAPSAVRTTVAAAPLLAAAVGRWQARAALAGRSLEVRCRCGTAAVSGSPAELARALDNLLANAIEHGGSRIVVTASARGGALRILVSDSGRGSQRPGGRRARSGLARRIGGRQRHGHGLRIVRRIAAEHGGSFALRAGAGATEAVLELPLAAGEARR